MTDDTASVAAEFADLASWCEGSSVLYERLCRICAADEFILDVAADHTPGQPAPQLLLAAVQDRLFATSGDATEDAGWSDLAAYYGSVVDDPRPPDDALPEAFREFVQAHESAIRELVATRRVQTNSVRRCVGLYPAFATIAERVDDAPLALLEVGSSAGLNLHWDRYQYVYRREGSLQESDAGAPDGTGSEVAVYRGGPSDSPVTVDTELREALIPPVPTDPPAAADRVGLDLHPLDPTDEGDARWLRALVWPEHHDRRRVLDAALDVARDDPPDVVAGDAVDDLHDVADRLPDDHPLVLFHTLVLYQFDDDAREAFTDAVHDVAAERDAPTYHLAGERPDPDRDNGIQLRLVRVEGSDSAERADDAAAEHLGTFEQHGAWIAWERSANAESDAVDVTAKSGGRSGSSSSDDAPDVVHENTDS